MLCKIEDGLKILSVNFFLIILKAITRFFNSSLITQEPRYFDVWTES